MTALIRLPCSYRSPSTCSDRGRSASTLPRSTRTLLRSPACWTIPVTTSVTRSTYSSYIISRSASRIRCRITCLAVCAAMRPKFSGVTSARLTCSSGTSDQSMRRSSSVTRVCDRSPLSSSAASSSEIARSRASSIRRSSMSGGSSIDQTRKSPLAWSSSTVACRAAPGVFLYAASKASSSARTRVSSSMPFSRSICLTASRISRLNLLPPFLDQVSADDGLVGDVEPLLPHSDRCLALTGVDDLPPEALSPGHLDVRPHHNALAEGAREVLLRAQRPLQSRRGDVHAVAFEIRPQLVRHPLAERMIHAGRVVDEHRDVLGPSELDGEHLDFRDAGLHGLGDLAVELSLFLVNLRHPHPRSPEKNGRLARP